MPTSLKIAVVQLLADATSFFSAPPSSPAWVIVGKTALLLSIIASLFVICDYIQKRRRHKVTTADEDIAPAG